VERPRAAPAALVGGTSAGSMPSQKKPASRLTTSPGSSVNSTGCAPSSTTSRPRGRPAASERATSIGIWVMSRGWSTNVRAATLGSSSVTSAALAACMVARAICGVTAPRIPVSDGMPDLPRRPAHPLVRRGVGEQVPVLFDQAQQRLCLFGAHGVPAAGRAAEQHHPLDPLRTARGVDDGVRAGVVLAQKAHLRQPSPVDDGLQV